MTDENKNDPPGRPPGFLQTVTSVAAAFFGVQNRANRERDFKHGKAVHFIVVGIALTLVLIVTLVVIVKLVLAQAGT